MSEGGSRRAVAEIRFGEDRIGITKVGGRSIHQYWTLLGPHFRDVFLAPQRRSDDGGVSWTWREAADKKPLTAAELASVDVEEAASVCDDMIIVAGRRSTSSVTAAPSTTRSRRTSQEHASSGCRWRQLQLCACWALCHLLRVSVARVRRTMGFRTPRHRP